MTDEKYSKGIQQLYPEIVSASEVNTEDLPEELPRSPRWQRTEKLQKLRKRCLNVYLEHASPQQMHRKHPFPRSLYVTFDRLFGKWVVVRTNQKTDRAKIILDVIPNSVVEGWLLGKRRNVENRFQLTETGAAVSTGEEVHLDFVALPVAEDGYRSDLIENMQTHVVTASKHDSVKFEGPDVYFADFGSGLIPIYAIDSDPNGKVMFISRSDYQALTRSESTKRPRAQIYEVDPDLLRIPKSAWQLSKARWNYNRILQRGDEPIPSALKITQQKILPSSRLPLTREFLKLTFTTFAISLVLLLSGFMASYIWNMHQTFSPSNFEEIHLDGGSR